MIEHVETTPGGMRIYKDTSSDIKLKFRGVRHPMSQDQVVPCLQDLLDGLIKNLSEQQEKGMTTVSLSETVNCFKTLREMTVPETGYYFCPEDNVIKQVPLIAESTDITKPILTKYGKKLLAEKSNNNS